MRWSLLSELVRSDFKLRYQGSVLGFSWSILKPLALFVVLYVVFSRFLRFDQEIDNYVLYLLLGIVLWNYFSEATKTGLLAIVQKEQLLRRVSMPRYALILPSQISALINFTINMLIVVIFLIFSDVELSSSVLWLPVLLAELFLLGLGVSLLLSSIYVRYRDVSHLWELALQIGFYATPILYPLSLVGAEATQKLLLMNPLAQIIQDFREVLVSTNSTTANDLGGAGLELIPIVIAIVVAISGLVVYVKKSPYFAELV